MHLNASWGGGGGVVGGGGGGVDGGEGFGCQCTKDTFTIWGFHTYT